jgi:homoserine dehydrogenase
VVGGIDPARELLLSALRAGKSVVSANKALLAEHATELFTAASKYRSARSRCCARCGSRWLATGSPG